jgi:ABC-type antimicrobial peptide transport system permease subunit
VLASLGLYGVVALAVTQRKREVGIRIAVGGRPARVARMFFVSGVRLSVIALLVGLPVSLGFLRILLAQGVLIAPDVRIWPIGLGIAVVLLAVSAAATWFPARRAARIDPALTLRTE